MASYPGSIIALINAVDNSTTILAAHVNNLYDELRNGVETTLGLNPASISDAVTPLASPATVAAYLDMVAYQLKKIIDDTAWYNAPATTLAALNTGKLSIPGGSTTGDLLYYNGTIYTRLAIGTSGQLLTVAGGVPVWVSVTAASLGAIPAPASPATGDLLYYTGAAWARLPVGATNQLLTVAGGIPVWANTVPGTLNDGQWTAWNAGGTRVDLQLRSPAVVSSGGVIAEYPTIQGAITAATSGQFVAVPPGTYDETITLKSGVVVVELIPGTVTINGGDGTAVVVVSGAFLSVDTIVSATNFNDVPVILVNGMSGDAHLFARRVAVTGPCTYGVVGSTSTASGGGELHLHISRIEVPELATGIRIADQIVYVYGTKFVSTGDTAIGIAATYTETVHAYQCAINMSDTDGIGVYAVSNLSTVNLYGCTVLGQLMDIDNGSGAAISVYGCSFTAEKTSGTLVFLEGDREKSGSPDIISGRLTLTSGTPVTSADVTAATTIYYTPFRGNRMALYHGNLWDTHTYAELSLGVTSSQTGTTSNGSAVVTALTSTAQLTVGMEVTGTSVPGSTTIASIDSATQITLNNTVPATGARTLTFKIPASKVVDVFMIDLADPAGVAICWGPLWANATTRATALTTVDGVSVLTGSYSVNGISYTQGKLRYVGTIATTTTAGETEDSLTFRGVWSLYNRKQRPVRKAETTGSWTYASTTWRQARATATNKVSFVVGVAEDTVFLTYKVVAGGPEPLMGIKLDATNAADEYGQGLYNDGAVYSRIVAAGYHDANMVEMAASGTATYYGSQSNRPEDCVLRGYVWG